LTNEYAEGKMAHSIGGRKVYHETKKSAPCISGDGALSFRNFHPEGRRKLQGQSRNAGAANTWRQKGPSTGVNKKTKMSRKPTPAYREPLYTGSKEGNSERRGRGRGHQTSKVSVTSFGTGKWKPTKRDLVGDEDVGYRHTRGKRNGGGEEYKKMGGEGIQGKQPHAQRSFHLAKASMQKGTKEAKKSQLRGKLGASMKLKNL